jgi:hypothetical protein
MDPLPKIDVDVTLWVPPTCSACSFQPPADIEPVHAQFPFCRPKSAPRAISPTQCAVIAIVTYSPPTYLPFGLHFDLHTTDQNRACAARFCVLQAKTSPPLDVPNATYHHLNYATNLTSHTLPSVRASICALLTETEPMRLTFAFCRCLG